MRLIDADSIRKPIYASDDNITGAGMSYDEQRGYNDAINLMWDELQSAPTIGIEPVRHGRWGMSSDIPDCIICDRCCAAFDVWKADIERHHYCPNCGAKMDLEED